MPWIRLLFRQKDPVFVRCNGAGELLTLEGRAEIRYKLTGKSYSANTQNLSPLKDGPSPIFADPPEENRNQLDLFSSSDKEHPAAKETKQDTPPPAAVKQLTSPSPAPVEPKRPTSPAQDPHAPSNEIVIYVDGACSGNPGPAGLGILFKDGEEIKEVSEYLGMGTNNIAELMAIKRALEMCPDRTRPIRIYTDSAYSLGMLTQNWKASANQELVYELRALLKKFPKVSLRKVAGHSGIVGNERADFLARKAIEDGTQKKS